MQNEKIAIIALAIIIIGALSIFLAATYGEDILDNLFPEEKTIEIGDCADVNFNEMLANGTVSHSSYTYPENKTGGTPLNIFITMNQSEAPPTEYPQYLSGLLIEGFLIEGFMEGLIGLKEGETATIGPIPPEKAYGVTPKVGDVIDLSALGGGDVLLKVLKINENLPIPSDFIGLLGEGITTIYVVRDESHYIGETIDTYVDNEKIAHWENATVVTKINETLLWRYTTPLEDKYENLTWVDANFVESYQITYPTYASTITSINETTFIVTITPEINETISFFDAENPYGLYYIIESVTDDKIITYLDDGASVENRTRREFDRSLTVQRNETFDITYSFPSGYLEMLLEYLRSEDSSIIYSTAELADKTLYFEVEIVEVYKTS